MSQKLSNLPVGAKVKFGKHSINGEAAQDITWLIVAKDHVSTPAYPSNSVTLLADKIIDIRPWDARELGNPYSDRVSWGNNNYSLSNIHQWLNSEVSSSWFDPSHGYDLPPDNEYVYSDTGYYKRPGFLSNFSTDEMAAILTTTVRSVNPSLDGGGYVDLSTRLFLPSLTEIDGDVTNGIAEGSRWVHFSNGNSWVAQPTAQVVEHSPVTGTSTTLDVNSGYDWWLRTPIYNLRNSAYVATAGGAFSSLSVCMGKNGIRPAMNIANTCEVSDTTDSDGCYTFIWNEAPTVPSSLNAPATINGGKANTITWGAATDPDGDAIVYVLECAYNGGTFNQIYSGTALSYSHAVTYGETSVQYRIKAVDPRGLESAYVTTDSLTIKNNHAPKVVGANVNLGSKSDGFSRNYAVSDEDGDEITITEAVDGNTIRSFVGNGEQWVQVTDETWLALANGSHTITITASDGEAVTTGTFSFVKNVDSLSIENTLAFSVSTQPTRIVLQITKSIPAESTIKIEVCNNGNDASPTWEDATSVLLSNLVYTFENTHKTASSWGVKVRIRVERNGASGACYISGIGGNFE